MIEKKSPLFATGAAMLANPTLPLVRIVQMPYITGPFKRIARFSMNSTNRWRWRPAPTLIPKRCSCPILKTCNCSSSLNIPGRRSRWTASNRLNFWVAQRILARELENINSLLCGPCDCQLCCLGPSGEMGQVFLRAPCKSKKTTCSAFPGSTPKKAGKPTSMPSRSFWRKARRSFRPLRPCITGRKTGVSFCRKAAPAPTLSEPAADARYIRTGRTPADGHRFSLMRWNDSPGTKPSKDRHTSPAVNFWRYGIAPMHRSFGRRSAPTRSSAALPPIFKWNKS